MCYRLNVWYIRFPPKYSCSFYSFGTCTKMHGSGGQRAGRAGGRQDWMMAEAKVPGHGGFLQAGARVQVLQQLLGQWRYSPGSWVQRGLAGAASHDECTEGCGDVSPWPKCSVTFPLLPASSLIPCPSRVWDPVSPLPLLQPPSSSQSALLNPFSPLSFRS